MTDEFARAYRATLETYVGSGREDQLEAAYALGREAFAGGMTLLELIDHHHAAVDALAQGTGSLPRNVATSTFELLAEALATFEMTQRGYWEAQHRARLEREQSLMLQNNLLPRVVPSFPGLDVAVRYLPGEAASHAGGDWYDLFELADGRAGLVVGDVSGHGVTAAAAMGQLRIAVLAYALAGFEPASVLQRVDMLLERLSAADEIATMLYMIVDPPSGELVVANAGHPPPIVIEPDRTSRLLTGGHSLLLGLSGGTQPRSHHGERLQPGSQLLLYTDGLAEPLERAGGDGFAQLLKVTDGFVGSAQDLCDHVLEQLTPRRSGDDICILVAGLESLAPDD